jgi:Fe-S-cluster containining protein
MTAPAAAASQHPGAVATWLRRTVAALRSYQAHEPFELAVPCGGCTACCHGYAVEVRPSDDQTLETVPGTGDYERILPHADDGACAYLIDDRCSVYARRPASCREYDCRRLFFCRLQGERADINAAINQWSPERVFKAPADRLAFDALMASRDQALEIDRKTNGGRNTIETAAVCCVALAYQRLAGVGL